MACIKCEATSCNRLHVMFDSYSQLHAALLMTKQPGAAWHSMGHFSKGQQGATQYSAGQHLTLVQWCHMSESQANMVLACTCMHFKQ